MFMGLAVCKLHSWKALEPKIPPWLRAISGAIFRKSGSLARKPVFLALINKDWGRAAVFEFLSYRVEDVMCSPVVTMRPDNTLAELELILEDQGFNGCPVVGDGDRLVGLVTSFDVLKAFRFDSNSMAPRYDQIMSTCVEMVMTRNPRTVPPDLPLSRVLEAMSDLRVTGLPVSADGRVVGMITRRDIMRALREATRASGEVS